MTVSERKSSQSWDPQGYAQHAGFVPELGKPVVEWLAPQSGERILDLGCGDGALTLELQRIGCQVVGVDASPEMIAAAQARGLEAKVVDGEALAFGGCFDAVFSNAALHWMTRPERVIAGVHRALVPGGRFIGEMGGAGNVASSRAALDVALAERGRALPCPWFFPNVATYRGLLEAGGFAVERIALIPRPTPLPGDVGGWLTTFAGGYLATVPAGEREAVIAEVIAALRPKLCDGQGRWIADYVRLRFAAARPD